MSVFKSQVIRHIFIYRSVLRKTLPQDKRMVKLKNLNLKSRQLYENEVALYHTAKQIVLDIRQTVKESEKGYYSYSGLIYFSDELESFLKQYSITSGRIVHKIQEAAASLVRAIQILGVPQAKRSDLKQELHDCGQRIAEYGVKEQKDLYLNTLRDRVHSQNQEDAIFFRGVLHQFRGFLTMYDARDLPISR